MTEPQGGSRTGESISILTEDSERVEGTDAQTANIDAGKAIATAVRTTLGPNGMDKMLVSDSGAVVITNGGSTVLEEMDVEHPAANVLAEVAQSQQQTVGDGTTTTAVLAGELLAAAEELLEQNIHPTTIVQGYAVAWARAMDAIDDQQLDEPSERDLQAVAESAITGKGIGGSAATALAESIVDAVLAVRTADGVDREQIDVVTRPGRDFTATETIEGLVAELDPVDDAMPQRLEEATVAVITDSLTTAESRARFQEHDVQYGIDRADQFLEATTAEERQLDEYAQAILDAGVDVVIVTETEEIDDRIVSQLTRAGVLAFDDVKDEVANAIREAAGGANVHQIDELAEEDVLGTAGSVRVEQFDDESYLIVEDTAAESPTTLLVRGSTRHVLAEGERAVTDGLDATVAALRGGVVPGGGATEHAVARAIRESVAGTRGREQLVVDRFADALDTVPRILAANAGMDPIDALVTLRTRAEQGTPAGIVGTGRETTIDDAVERGVLDPADVKRDAVRNATEAATLIVRIDDVISAK